MSDGWTISIDATAPPGADLTAEAIDDLADLAAARAGIVAALPGRISITFSIDPTSTETDELTSIRDAALAGLERSLGGDPQTATRDAAITLEGCRIARDYLTAVGAGDWTIVHIDARTFAEHDAELAQPAMPALVGVAELGALLGVSPQRASELRSREGFPAPVAELKSGPVWVKANVEHFASTWKRSPGRPKKIAPVEAQNSRS